MTHLGGGQGGGVSCIAAPSGRAGSGGVRRCSPAVTVKLTGLSQNLQVDPAVCLKIPIRALELTQILGQPCEFQVVPVCVSVSQLISWPHLTLQCQFAP
jgi:hypothetical protein